MSVRLNKVGHILDALPLGPNSVLPFGVGTKKPWMISDRTVYPFDGHSFVGKQFRAYSSELVGSSGATVNYAGGGGGHFRDGKGDYFCAGFELSPLIDPDRPDTDTLVSLSSFFQTVTPPTQGIPDVIPMIIWTNDTSSMSDGTRTVNAYTYLPLDTVNKFSAGVLHCYYSLKSDVVVPMHGFKRVFFAWYLGRPYPGHNSGEFSFNEVGTSVSAASLRGNRPVFDPVMV